MSIRFARHLAENKRALGELARQTAEFFEVSSSCFTIVFRQQINHVFKAAGLAQEPHQLAACAAQVLVFVKNPISRRRS